MLQGQMNVRIARAAQDPVTVTALAVEGTDGSDGTVFISCDMAYVMESLLESIRRRLAKECPDLPAANLVLNATHTHTSFVIDDDFYPRPEGDVMTPAEAMEWVAERAAEAAAEAWKGRKPRVVGWAFGHAVVGHNRYAVYADGTGQMYGQTNRDDFAGMGGYVDHGMDMMFTWDPDGALAGIALAIPCPSQVEEHLEVFSADYWHEVRAELRSRLGSRLQVLPICSAAGDQSPHLLILGREEAEMRRRRGLTERQEIAQRVGDAVERALTCTHATPGPVVFKHTVQTIGLDRFRIMPEHRVWAKKMRDQWIAGGGQKDAWWPRDLQWVIDSANRPKQKPFPVTIHTVRIGNAVVVTNPFELFLDYGMQIKARSPAAQTVTMQLAGGRGMYLPSARAIKAGGYGANPVVCSVGPEGGAMLVETTLRLIRKMFGEREKGHGGSHGRKKGGKSHKQRG